MRKLFLVWMSVLVVHCGPAGDEAEFEDDGPQIEGTVQDLDADDPWVVRSGLTAAQYQVEFDKWTGLGYRPTSVSGYEEGGSARFAAVWQNISGPAWQARHGLTAAQYQAAFDTLKSQGYRPISVNGYSVSGTAYFNAIFHKDPSIAWISKHGQTGDSLQADFDTLPAQGYRVTHMSGYMDAGVQRFAAIWQKRNDYAWKASYGLSAAQYDATVTQRFKEGYSIVFVTGYRSGNADRFAAIFHKTTTVPVEATIQLTPAQYQRAVDDLKARGYRPVLVSAYSDGTSERFGLLWQTLGTPGTEPFFFDPIVRGAAGQLCNLAGTCDSGLSCATSMTCLASGSLGGVSQPCRSDFTCDTGHICTRRGASENSVCESPLGKVARSYGGLDNRCVEGSVPFWAVELSYGYQSSSVTYASREGTSLPPDNSAFPDLDHITDHVQGIGRIPGSAGERLMAMTISNSDGNKRGGLFFVNVGQAAGNGGEAFWAGDAGDKSKNRNVAYYSLPSDHPGGLAVMGQVVATVGVDSTLGRPAVWFFDVSSPTTTAYADALIQRVDLNALGPDVTNSASAVAVTRLKSGRYFMIVNGGSLGTTRKVWMYISDGTSLSASTRWRYHRTQEYTVAFGTENFTFLTECDGSVYLLHNSNDSTTIGNYGVANKVATLQLTTRGNLFELQSANASTGWFQDDGYCNFRAAASYHVTPSGNMVLYCNSRSLINEDGNFKFAEFPWNFAP